MLRAHEDLSTDTHNRTAAFPLEVGGTRNVGHPYTSVDLLRGVFPHHHEPASFGIVLILFLSGFVPCFELVKLCHLFVCAVHKHPYRVTRVTFNNHFEYVSNPNPRNPLPHQRPKPSVYNQSSRRQCAQSVDRHPLATMMTLCAPLEVN